MMYDIDNLPGYIDLGQLSEKGAKEIEFDVTEWVTEHPTGTFSISYIRPTETTVYPVAAGDISTATALGVTTLTWAISDTVTAIAGAGSMVVQLAVADTVVKRSRLVQTIVQEGHSSAGDPPDPVQDWVADATSKLAETISATEAANKAAGLATDATDRANAIAGTLEGIAPRWSGVDISVSALGEGVAPTASITQGENGTSITLGIPKGDTGAQGEQGEKGDGYKPKGQYLSNVQYEYLNVVTDGGSSYAYIYPTPAAGVPVTETSHWQQIAAKGDQGNQGIQSINRTSGDGTPGSTDTYTILYNDGTSSDTFTVYNGADGNISGVKVNGVTKTPVAGVVDITELGGLSLSVDPTDKGLNITYTY